MRNNDKLVASACCAPLPRELNNYYNRCHSKNKNQADCKGSCYCDSANCDCRNKGLNERSAIIKTNNCQCCNYTKPKETCIINSAKQTCQKCKRPKRQVRSISPTGNNTKNCRCCHKSQRLSSPPPKPVINNCKCPKNQTADKKYILCYKPYEDGDSMLDISSKENILGVDRQPVTTNCPHGNRKYCCQVGCNGEKGKGLICTCGLVKPCDCGVEGMWCIGGGVDEAAPPCRRCGKKVYAAEKLIASGGAFHTSCFSCFACHKALEVTNLYESQGEIYCKQCYTKYFGMSGYGYGTTLLSPV